MRKVYLLAAFVAAAGVLAACSNSTTTTPPAAGGTGITSPSGGGTMTATVQASDNASFGKILTDSQGKTLYLFQQDQGTKSSCDATCLSTWPALTVSGMAHAGTGLDASLLGTAKQAGGSMQVTYNGHLLYLYTGDAAPGDTNGQGLEGFLVVSSAGQPVQQPTAGSSSSSAYHY